MRAVERRLAALEARRGKDQLRVIFVSWIKPNDTEQKRRMVERGGERYLQEPDESEDAFLARVKAVVEQEPSSGSCVKTVFVRHVSWDT